MAPVVAPRFNAVGERRPGDGGMRGGRGCGGATRDANVLPSPLSCPDAAGTWFPLGADHLRIGIGWPRVRGAGSVVHCRLCRPHIPQLYSLTPQPLSVSSYVSSVSSITNKTIDRNCYVSMLHIFYFIFRKVCVVSNKDYYLSIGINV